MHFFFFVNRLQDIRTLKNLSISNSFFRTLIYLSYEIFFVSTGEGQLYAVLLCCQDLQDTLTLKNRMNLQSFSHKQVLRTSRSRTGIDLYRRPKDTCTTKNSLMLYYGKF